MDKLYVLPNGDGVDPTTILSVRFVPKNDIFEDIRCHVAVAATCGHFAVYFDNPEDAKLARDKIINNINALKEDKND